MRIGTPQKKPLLGHYPPNDWAAPHAQSKYTPPAREFSFWSFFTCGSCCRKKIPHDAVVTIIDVPSASTPDTQVTQNQDPSNNLALKKVRFIPQGIEPLREVIKEIVLKITAIYREHYINPQVPKLPEYLDTASRGLEKVSKLLLNFARKQLGDEFIDFYKPDTKLCKFITFLLEPQTLEPDAKKKADYQSGLFKYLSDELTKKCESGQDFTTRQAQATITWLQAIYDQDVNKAIAALDNAADQGMIGWLINSPPANSDEDKKAQATAFEFALEKVIEHKIEYEKQQTSSLIKPEKLDHLFKTLVQDNVEQITDFFTERLGWMLACAEFPPLFDELIHNGVHVPIDAAAQGKSEMELLLALTNKGVTPSSTTDKQIGQFLSDKLIHLFFDLQHEKKEGFAHPIFILLKNFKWPKEWKELYAQVKGFLKEPLKHLEESLTDLSRDQQGIAQIINRFMAEVYPPFMELITSLSEEISNQVLSGMFAQQITTWTQKENVDDLVARVIFPSLNLLILRAFLTSLLLEQLPALHTHYLNRTPHNREERLEALVQYFNQKLAERQFPHSAQILGMIKEAYRPFHEALWALLDKDQVESDAGVYDKIRKYIEGETRKEDPTFNKIIHNLVYSPNLGNFSFQGVFTGLLLNIMIAIPGMKNKVIDGLGSEASNATIDLRKNHVEATELLVQALKESSLVNPLELKSMLLDPPAPINHQQVAAQLDDQMHIAKELLYHTIMDKAKPRFGEANVKIILGQGEPIYQTIRNIYDRITGNPHLLRSLVVRISSVVCKHFEAAYDKKEKITHG